MTATFGTKTVRFQDVNSARSQNPPTLVIQQIQQRPRRSQIQQRPRRSYS